jgi:hypothetical protein
MGSSKQKHPQRNTYIAVTTTAFNGLSEESKYNLEKPDRNGILRPTSPTDGEQQTALISPPLTEGGLPFQPWEEGEITW